MKLFIVFTLIIANIFGFSLCHHTKRDLTAGAISILKSYNELVVTKHVCTKNANGLFYGATSTMPSNQYAAGMYGGSTSGPTVSYSSNYNTGDLTTIYNIWDYSEASILATGACVPIPNFFPYPHIGSNTDDVFLVKFIPMDLVQGMQGTPVWDNFKKLKAIDLSEIKRIKAFYKENEKGYINTKFHSAYVDKASALGIVCEIVLNNGQKISCYLVTLDMQDNPGGHVLWKN